jgi:biopolymer transport protein ExbD
MKLTRKKRLKADDSTASSDIAFLLIIYFIVIAGFNINKGFLVNLPARDSSRLILKEDLLRFDLDEAGRIVFQGEIINRAGAEQVIKAGIGVNPNIAVILTIDGEAPWQQVVSFVESAQKLSVDSFSFTIKTTGSNSVSAGGGRP